MLTVDIPGRAPLEISHLALDLNGTLALDGYVPPAVVGRLHDLASRVHLHILTADTFGTAASLSGFDVQITVLKPGDQTEAKVRGC